MGGYIYLICDPANDTYKIGVTRNLNSNRIKNNDSRIILILNQHPRVNERLGGN